MKKETPYDRIEGWLDGTLPPDERLQFEAQMLADPALAAETEAQKAVRLAMRRLGERDLQANLKKMLTEMDVADASVPTPSAAKWRIRKILIILLVVLLVGTTWKLLFQSPQSSISPLDTERIAAAQKDSLIAVMTSDFYAKKTALDSIEALQNNSKNTEPDTIRQRKTQQLREEIGKKDLQIRQLKQQKAGLEGQKIARQFYKKDNMTESTALKRGGAQRITDRQYDAAAATFDKGKYSAVIPQLFPGNLPPENDLNRFRKWLENDSTMNYERLNLLGQTYFCLNKIPEAVTCFELIKDFQSAWENDKDEWFLFLFRVARPERYQPEIRAYIKSVKLSQDSEYKNSVKQIEEALLKQGLLK